MNSMNIMQDCVSAHQRTGCRTLEERVTDAVTNVISVMSVVMVVACILVVVVIGGGR